MMDDQTMGTGEDWVLMENEPMYRKLRIYEAAGGLSDEIWGVVALWTPFARDTLGNQLVRSADSIAANLAEGSGRGTNPELVRFARIARGSLCETQHWISRASHRKLIEPQKAQHLQTALKSLLKQLNAFISTMANKHP